MKQRQRIYYSAAQRAEIWDRWQRGESMSSIGRLFDWQSSSIFSVLSPSGGIRPAERGRSGRALRADVANAGIASIRAPRVGHGSEASNRPDFWRGKADSTRQSTERNPAKYDQRTSSRSSYASNRTIARQSYTSHI